MQFMLLLYADEKAGAAIPADQMARAMETLGAYEAALSKAGAFVMTSPLARTHDARTIRMEGGAITTREGDDETYFVAEGGQMQVHAGPYAETREQLGGFYIIEAADLEAAVDWAKRCPAAQWGPIEVRAMIAGF